MIYAAVFAFAAWALYTEGHPLAALWPGVASIFCISIEAWEFFGYRRLRRENATALREDEDGVWIDENGEPWA